MFSLFIVLLSFSESLAREAKVAHRTKCLFLNDESCMVRSTLMDVISVGLKYYPFMISWNECNGSCNVLSPKTCVPKETRDVNVKELNMITNKDEAKVMAKHIPRECKCKTNSTTCNSNQKWNNKTR